MQKFNPTASLAILLFMTLVVLACSNQTQEMQERNKELVRYITEEGLNKQNPDKWDEVLTADYIRHCQAMPPEFQEMRGAEISKKMIL